MNTYLHPLKALADPTRLRLLGALRQGAFHVNELVSILGVGQSRVSRHLRILADAALVEARRDGNCVYYQLAGCWSGRADGPPLRFLRVLARELDPLLDGDRAAVRACLSRRRERAERFFREVAGHWDSHRVAVEGFPTHLDRLCAAVSDGGTVVDLGTGTGILLSRLANRVQRVIGVDASNEMLEVARGKIVESVLKNVELRLGAVEHLPLADASADTVVANMVLHHVVQPVVALREVRRVLRVGGSLVLADYCRHEREVFRERLGDLWLGFDPQELERWVVESGLELVSMEAIRSSGIYRDGPSGGLAEGVNQDVSESSDGPSDEGTGMGSARLAPSEDPVAEDSPKASRPAILLLVARRPGREPQQRERRSEA